MPGIDGDHRHGERVAQERTRPPPNDAREEHHERARRWISRVGNEEYFPRRYGFSAPDYAAEVVAYANAMKAVDPSIRIGAVGPFSATEGSFIDRLTPNGLQKFESMTDDELDAKKEALGQGQEGLLDWLNDGVKVTPRAWWDVVAEEAGAKLDFIILHRYDATRAKCDFSKPVTIADTIRDVRQVVAKHKSGGALDHRPHHDGQPVSRLQAG